jgi:hypothetical protein
MNAAPYEAGNGIQHEDIEWDFRAANGVIDFGGQQDLKDTP